MNLSTTIWKYWIVPCCVTAGRSLHSDIDCNQGRGETLTIHLHPVRPQWCHRLWRGEKGKRQQNKTKKKVKSQHTCIHQVTTVSASWIPFLLPSSLQEYQDPAACKQYKAVIERLRKNTQWSSVLTTQSVHMNDRRAGRSQRGYQKRQRASSSWQGRMGLSSCFFGSAIHHSTTLENKEDRLERGESLPFFYRIFDSHITRVFYRL